MPSDRNSADKAQQWMGLAILALTPLAVAVVAIYSLLSLEKMDRLLREPLIKSNTLAHSIHLLARDQALNTRTFLITAETAYLEVALQEGALLKSQAESLYTLTEHDSTIHLSREILRLEDLYRDGLEQVRGIILEEGDTGRVLPFFLNVLEPRRRELEQAAARLAEMQTNRLSQAEDEMDRMADASQYQVGAVALAAIFLTLWLALFLGRRLARSQRGLRQSRSRLNSIVQSAMDAVITIDESQRIVLFNKTAENIFRYPAEKALGEHINRFIPQRFRQAHVEHVRRFGETGVTARSMGRLGTLYGLRADGEEFPLEAAISQTREADKKLFTVILRDITDRKRSQEALEYQSRLTGTILENASMALFLLDQSGSPTYMNPAAEELIGYRLEELKARPFHEVIRPAKEISPHGREGGPLERALRKLAPLKNHEDVFFRKDGTEFPVLCALEPIRNDHQAAGAVLEVVDLTERKMTEKALKESEERLRQSQKMEAIGQLAGGIAHDFNNLLTAINGYSELALAQSGNRPQLRDNLQEIRHAGQRAAELTRQLLAYSRRQMVLPKVLSMNQIVTNFSKLLRRLIGENIELVMDLEPELRLSRLDAGQVEQAILNLVLNARDAMPEGGRLILRTRNAPGLPERGLVTEARPGEFVELAVEDTGTGIAPELRPHIFEPFFTTKGVGKGTGLGLASLYGTVTQVGGAIALESTPGKGSTFRLFFPAVLHGEEAAAQPGQAVEEIPRAEGETVLLVEDESTVRRFIRKILESHGFRVIEAEDGDQAERVFREYPEPIGLLVTDVVMPGKSGRALARRLTELNPGLKVLLLSGYTEESMEMPSAGGSDGDFLQKPFSPDQLLRKLLEMRRMSPGTAQS